MELGYLQVLPPRRCNSCLEHWALDLHVGLVKRAHDGLDVILIYFGKEVFDCFFRLRTRRVGGDRSRVSCCSAAARWVEGLVEE